MKKKSIKQLRFIIFGLLILIVIVFAYQKTKNNSPSFYKSSRQQDTNSEECKEGVLALNLDTRICKFYPSKCNIPSNNKIVDICKILFRDINWDSPWKTYEDKKRGFNLELPENVMISYDDSSLNTQINIVGDDLYSVHSQDGILLDFSSGPLEGKSLETIAKNIRDQLINDPQNSVAIKSSPVSLIEIANLGGVKGYSFAGPFGKYWYLPLIEGYLVVTTRVQDPNSLGYQEYVDRMLSTFRISE